jgi:hypothetical protein
VLLHVFVKVTSYVETHCAPPEASRRVIVTIAVPVAPSCDQCEVPVSSNVWPEASHVSLMSTEQLSEDGVEVPWHVLELLDVSMTVSEMAPHLPPARSTKWET